MFALNRVTKSLGGSRVLDSITLEIPNGKTTVLLGPSGCGKSTLLRGTLLGLLRPDSGEVRFANGFLTPANVLDQRRRMGYVVQDGGLFPAFHRWRQRHADAQAYRLGAPPRIDARRDELTQLVRLAAEVMDALPRSNLRRATTTRRPDAGFDARSQSAPAR